MIGSRMENKVQYTNGEITIVWKPGLCRHSGKCVRGLPQVFRPQERPWVTIQAADSKALARQVSLCPSGALSYFWNDPLKTE